jgi:hypothetical protein
VAIYMKIGAIYERMGDGKGAIEHYEQLEKRVSAPIGTVFEARSKIAKLKKSSDEYKAIWERYAKLKGDARKDERVAKAAAEARFELFEPTYQEYIGIKLKLPQSTLTANLVRKAKMLAEIEKEYTNILAIGNADYGIASLARIGMAYHDFSKALFDAPVPPGLTDEQREIYLSELQNKAFPIEEKAIDAYEKTLQKAQELHVYTEWTTRAQDRLAQFKPAEFPESRRLTLQPADRFGAAALSGDLRQRSGREAATGVMK